MDRTIPAGHTEKVQFTIDTNKRSGSLNRSVAVSTNDMNLPKATLICEGSVKAAIKANPAVVNFGRVNRDAQAQQKTVTITRGEGGPIKPELLPPASKNVEATIREVEPGERYDLDVTIKPPWPNANLRGTIALATGLDEAPRETINVYAQVAPRVEAVPARFTVPATVAADLELVARVAWSGAAPGKLLEATCNDPKLAVRLEEREGNQTVILSVPVGYEAPIGTAGFVVVKTDDSEFPTLRIPVFMNRAARPAVRVAKPLAKPPVRTTEGPPPTDTPEPPGSDE